MDMLLVASTDVMIKTNIYRHTKFCCVQTSEGTRFWCIAFAVNNLISERLPTSAPSEIQGFEGGCCRRKPHLTGTKLLEIKRQRVCTPPMKITNAHCEATVSPRSRPASRPLNPRAGGTLAHVITFLPFFQTCS
ncbi:hypothetical protein BDR03DRAFT_956219 [Suillus americanus]|nr:hypothetical protein BDR03DRAFT_956219 [Suillus americanus]